ITPSWGPAEPHRRLRGWLAAGPPLTARLTRPCGGTLPWGRIRGLWGGGTGGGGGDRAGIAGGGANGGARGARGAGGGGGGRPRPWPPACVNGSAWQGRAVLRRVVAERRRRTLRFQAGPLEELADQ